MLHLEDRCGSLEKGKGRRLRRPVGAPFSVYTQVLETSSRRQGLRPHQARGLDLPIRRFRPGEPEAPAKQYPAAKPQAAVSAPEVPANAPKLNGTPKRLAVYAGRIYTVGKGTITDGVILVEDGKVTHVGPRNGFQLPADTPVLTAAVVTPGLIDTQTVVGVSGMLNMRRPTRTRTKTATRTRPIAGCWTASTPASRSWSSCASTA